MSEVLKRKQLEFKNQAPKKKNASMVFGKEKTCWNGVLLPTEAILKKACLAQSTPKALA